eukprot:403343949
MGGKDSKPTQELHQQTVDPNQPKPEYCQKKNVRSTMPEEKKKEIEHFGNEGAPHFMIVEYCNGCGYYRYAVSVAEKIESLYPQQFYIELRPDSEQTGRLDVTMFINQQNKQIVDMSSGYKFHATDKGDDIPYKNWEAFTNKVDNALLGQ